MLRPEFPTVKPVAGAELVRAPVPAGDARQEAFDRSMSALLGKSVAGEVLAKLTDGTYLVRVAGHAARMPLPPGAQAGASVALTLVALGPRPTFQVGTQPGAVEAQLGYGEAGLAPEPHGSARGAPLVYLDGGAPVRAGQTTIGTPIAAAMPAAPDTPEAAAASAAELAAQGRAALASGLPAAAQQAAAQAGAPPAPRPGAAQAGRATSYAATLLGQAPLVPAELLPEIDPHSTPAQLSPTAQALTAVLANAARAAASGAGQSAIVAQAPLVAAGPVQPEQLAQALRNAVGNSGLFYEAHVKEWSAGQLPLAQLAQEPQAQAAAQGRPPQASDPATAAFINLQLGTQEHQRIMWQGPAWPGQPMQWEVQRDAPERQPGGQDGTAPGWRSGVRFRFAALGEVNATVVLQGDRVHVQIDTGDGATGALLRAAAPALASALDAAGTRLSGFTVHARGGRDD